MHGYKGDVYMIMGHITHCLLNKQGGRRQQRERQENNKFILVKQHAFVYISLQSLHDYYVKVPKFTFCRGREHKTTTFFFNS